MYRIDDCLQVNYEDAKYRITKTQTDSGEDVWKIAYNPHLNNEGKEINDIGFTVRRLADPEINPSKINIKAAVNISISSSQQDIQMGFFTVKILLFVCAVSDGKNAYAFVYTRVGREESLHEEAALIAQHANATLASITFHNKPIEAETITAEMVLDPPEGFDASGERIKPKFERAMPGEDQHFQLDFQKNTRSALGMFGGLVNVNATGTEFSCNALDEEMCSDQLTASLFERINAADKQKSNLADRARTLSQIFYTSPEAFDAAHDRKSEIENALIQRAYMYDGLRSFGWTLAAYCEERNVKPADVDFDTLSEITAYIKKNQYLNFKPDSHLMTLCGGDDMHMYFIPDSVATSDRKALQIYAKADDDDHKNRIMSLEGYRTDLEYLYPAMLTLARKFYAGRDEDEVLAGDEAEILYAWCSCAVGSEHPFFIEDGPMNNMFSHPLGSDNWELVYAKQREEEQKHHEEEWIKAHGKELNRSAVITFKDRKFVFDTYFEGDERMRILEKLTKKGGLERTSVSGQTDYLVCDPKNAGESKLRAIREQRAKGRCLNTKIVHVDDFFKALGYTPAKADNSYSTKEQSIKDKIQNEKDALAKLLGRTETIKKPEPVKEAELHLTYREGLRFENEDYAIDIPDGFVVTEGEEDRDFVASRTAGDELGSLKGTTIRILPGQTSEPQFDFMTAEGMIDFFLAIDWSSEAQKIFTKQETVRYERADLPGVLMFGIEDEYVNAQAYLAYGNQQAKQFRVEFTDIPRREEKSCFAVAREIVDHLHTKKPFREAEQPDSERFQNSAMSSTLIKEWCELVDRYHKEIAIVHNANIKAAKAILLANGSPAKVKKKLQKCLEHGAQRKDALLGRCCKTFSAQAEKDNTQTNLAQMQKKLDELLGSVEFGVTVNGEKLSAVCPNAKLYREQINKAYTKTSAYAAEAERKAGEEAKRKAEAEAKRKAAAEAKEQKKKDALYNDALKRMTSNDLKELEAAKQAFCSIPDWKDSEKQFSICEEKVRKIKKAQREIEEATQKLPESLRIIREGDVSERIQSIKQRIKSLEKLQQEYPSLSEELNRLEKRVEELGMQSVALNERQKTLGLFKLKEKQEVKRLIAENEAEHANCSEQIESIRKKIGAFTSAERLASTLSGEREQLKKFETAVLTFSELEKKAPNALLKTQMEDKSNQSIFFGRYPKDGDPIEWKVLEARGNRLLLISQYILDCQPFHTTVEDITWDKCTLRTWLNKDFLKNVFTGEEQKLIQTTKIEPEHFRDRDLTYEQGRSTQDKIFLISYTEAQKYFPNHTGKCKATKYCSNRGIYTASNGCSYWWMRTMGHTNRICGYVAEEGSLVAWGIRVDGAYKDYILSKEVYGNYIGIRPVMWVQVD